MMKNVNKTTSLKYNTSKFLVINLSELKVFPYFNSVKPFYRVKFNLIGHCLFLIST